MREDQHKFLMLPQLPVRVNVEQASWLLNCQLHDVPVLVAAKILKPLGNPPPNGTKYFATKEVLEHAQDEKWLHRLTQALYQHWQKKNARKKEQPQLESEPFPASAN